MKQFKILISLVIALQSPFVTKANNESSHYTGRTPAEQKPSHTLTLHQQIQDYAFTSPDGKIETVKVELNWVQTETKEDVDAAKKWLIEQEARHEISDDLRFIINMGNESLEATHEELLPFRHEVMQPVQLPISGFKALSSQLSELIKSNGRSLNMAAGGSPISEERRNLLKSIRAEKRVEAKKRVDDLINKFTNDELKIGPVRATYSRTFGFTRFIFVGAAVSASFLAGATPLPLLPALVTGFSIGAISGLIQLKVKEFSNFLEKKGALYDSLEYSTKLAANILAAVHATNNNIPLSEAQHITDKIMNSEFTQKTLYNANLITKWFATEVAILAFMNTLLASFGVPLEATLSATVASILLVSAAATLAQGVWEFAIINANRITENNISELAKKMTSDGEAFLKDKMNKLKFSLSIKFITVALITNAGAAMMLVPDPGVQAVGSFVMKTMSVAGGTYYGYVLLQSSAWFQTKVSELKQFYKNELSPEAIEKKSQSFVRQSKIGAAILCHSLLSKK